MKKFLLLLCLIGVIKSSFACSCGGYEPNFYNNVTVYSYNCIAVFDTLHYSYLNGGFHSQIGYFTLIDTLNYMPTDIGESIVVLGLDGFSCNEDLSDFKKGDTLVLALYSAYFENFEGDTFSLFGACGKHYLQIENGQHDGLTIPEIKEKILSILSDNEQVDNHFSTTVYPNPTSDNIFIAGESQKIISISILDFTGRKLMYRKEENEIYSMVDLSVLCSGIYFLSISTDNGTYLKTIIKQ